MTCYRDSWVTVQQFCHWLLQKDQQRKKSSKVMMQLYLLVDLQRVLHLVVGVEGASSPSQPWAYLSGQLLCIHWGSTSPSCNLSLGLCAAAFQLFLFLYIYSAHNNTVRADWGLNRLNNSRNTRPQRGRTCQWTSSVETTSGQSSGSCPHFSWDLMEKLLRRDLQSQNKRPPSPDLRWPLDQNESLFGNQAQRKWSPPTLSWIPHQQLLLAAKQSRDETFHPVQMSRACFRTEEEKPWRSAQTAAVGPQRLLAH